MNIEIARVIIREDMSDVFDSHDFIVALISRDKDSYDEIMRKCPSTGSAHGIISIYLGSHTNDLGIEKIEENVTHKSENINGNVNQCAQWRKVQ